MSFFDMENLRACTGGRWLRPPGPGATVTGVGTDTRSDLHGRAFVAIAGERHDGHDHVAAAIEAGATLLIVDRTVGPALTGMTGMTGMTGKLGVLLVDDTRRALGRVAHAYRRTLTDTVVVGITGSCGKTTVKHMLHHVLSQVQRGTAATKSFNNDIGVPLTILAANPRDEYLVLEIGTNHPGEIDALARLAEPDVGVITMIGRSHLEGFGSVEGVAREKASLLHHLTDAGGGAVVNADAPELRACLPDGPAITLFGDADDADLRLAEHGSAPGGGHWFEISGGRRVGLGLPGRHNAMNALAVVAVARRLGVPDHVIDEALATCPPIEMRMSRHEVGQVTVFNDAYNANPDSMTASLDSFADLAAGARRRVVVLGDMLELGESSAEAHREIGRRLLDLDRRLPVDRLVLVGEMSGHIAEPIDWAPSRIVHLPELDPQRAAKVASMLEPGDAVLLKGSRGLGLERVLEALMDPQR